MKNIQFCFDRPDGEIRAFSVIEQSDDSLYIVIHKEKDLGKRSSNCETVNINGHKMQLVERATNLESRFSVHPNPGSDKFHRINIHIPGSVEEVSFFDSIKKHDCFIPITFVGISSAINKNLNQRHPRKK